MSISPKEADNMWKNVFHTQSYTIAQDILDWIRDNMSPEDVFEKERLEEWARANDWDNCAECDRI